MTVIAIEPLTGDAFAPFGDILDTSSAPDKIINQGLCGRYHDRATMDFSDGKVGISLFQAELRSFPITLDLMERHPDGSQAFIPMSMDPFIVVAAADDGGQPAKPRAFITTAGQGINFHRNTWHGVLTPIKGTGLFAVVDRIGDGPNLEEHWFKTPYTIRSLV